MARVLLPLVVLLIPALVACGSDDPIDDPMADASTGGVDAPTSDPVPTNAADMFAFLQRGDYLAYEAESAVRPSNAPHGAGGVRTFLNPSLAFSLAAGNTEHPVGAASFKELYASDGTTVSGWAAGVKVAEGTAANTWYWYEVFSTTDGSRPIEGIGNTTCTGCHSAGVDYVRIQYPLP